MGIVITSALAVLFFCLYILKAQDNKILQKDNEHLKQQRDSVSIIPPVDNQDDILIDTQKAMEAIRFNGFVPELGEGWITFRVQGVNYHIDTDRLPVLVMLKHYNLDKSKWDMDLMRQAAHQASDDIIIGKATFMGKDEDGLAFQIAAVGETFGHLRYNLARYIEIIDETHSRMIGSYNELIKVQKEKVALLPTLETSGTGTKKITS